MLRRKKAYAHAKALGLTRDDRLQLAEVLLWRDVASWKDLDDEAIKTLLAAMEGYILIGWLKLDDRQPLPLPT